MADVKGSERSYSSPPRAQHADATRRAVLNAASELFIAQGYGATTVDRIAAGAGVSKQTVFSAVGNKQTVLSAVLDVAMAGDDEKLSMVERPLAEEIRQEPDPHRPVELLAGLFTGVGRRYARIDEVLRGADHSGEPGLRELWQTSEERRLTGARIWATSLLGKGRFRDGVGPRHGDRPGLAAHGTGPVPPARPGLVRRSLPAVADRQPVAAAAPTGVGRLPRCWMEWLRGV
ncbi:MAG: transcriptional regulator, TetR family [Frankiales bacterium]|nr:transcriptional regulator, TetR family [Frankiales bacterium]